MDLVINKPEKVCGIVNVGGDKSVTHRALIISAIAEGRTRIFNYSRSKDCQSTAECLRKLSIDIERTKECYIVKGKGLYGFKEPEDVLDCGNSGTTMRLLASLLAGRDFFSVLSGDGSLRNRPMKRIIEPLTLMGAKIYARKNGLAPLCIAPARLKGIDYIIPVASAQVKSALMLALLYADGLGVIEESSETRDHTERMFEAFSISFKKTGNRIEVFSGQRFNGIDVNVPDDISSAAFFLTLGAIAHDSEIVIKDTGINPTRTGIIEILQQAGAGIEMLNKRSFGNEPVADIEVSGSEIKPFMIEKEIVPRLIDEIPVLAVAATQAKGTTIVKDARELRVKETDRLRVIVQELKKMGARIEEREDGFVVEGRTQLIGAVCDSHNDHRIAMALAIAGLIAEGETVIKNAECINISFPDFISVLEEVCGEDAIATRF